MNIQIKKSTLILLVLLQFSSAFLSPSAQAGGAWSELDESKYPGAIDRVMTGQIHIQTKDGPKESAWPEVIVFQVIHATPEESMAVFSDYEQHVNYSIPILSEVKIDERLNQFDEKVTYTMDLGFPLGKVHYTLIDKLSGYTVQDGKSYRLDWTYVKADTLSYIEGNVRFEAFRNKGPDGYRDETLMVYRNFTVPTRIGAKFFVSKMISEIGATVATMKRQMEMEKADPEPLLNAQLKALRERGELPSHSQ